MNGEEREGLLSGQTQQPHVNGRRLPQHATHTTDDDEENGTSYLYGSSVDEVPPGGFGAVRQYYTDAPFADSFNDGDAGDSDLFGRDHTRGDSDAHSENRRILSSSTFAAMNHFPDDRIRVHAPVGGSSAGTRSGRSSEKGTHLQTYDMIGSDEERANDEAFALCDVEEQMLGTQGGRTVRLSQAQRHSMRRERALTFTTAARPYTVEEYALVQREMRKRYCLTMAVVAVVAAVLIGLIAADLKSMYDDDKQAEAIQMEDVIVPQSAAAGRMGSDAGVRVMGRDGSGGDDSRLFTRAGESSSGSSSHLGSFSIIHAPRWYVEYNLASVIVAAVVWLVMLVGFDGIRKYLSFTHMVKHYRSSYANIAFAIEAVAILLLSHMFMAATIRATDVDFRKHVALEQMGRMTVVLIQTMWLLGVSFGHEPYLGSTVTHARDGTVTRHTIRCKTLLTVCIAALAVLNAVQALLAVMDSAFGMTHSAFVAMNLNESSTALYGLLISALSFEYHVGATIRILEVLCPRLDTAAIGDRNEAGHEVIRCKLSVWRWGRESRRSLLFIIFVAVMGTFFGLLITSMVVSYGSESVFETTCDCGDDDDHSHNTTMRVALVELGGKGGGPGLVSGGVRGSLGLAAGGGGGGSRSGRSESGGSGGGGSGGGGGGGGRGPEGSEGVDEHSKRADAAGAGGSTDEDEGGLSEHVYGPITTNDVFVVTEVVGEVALSVLYLNLLLTRLGFLNAHMHHARLDSPLLLLGTLFAIMGKALTMPVVTQRYFGNSNVLGAPDLGVVWLRYVEAITASIGVILTGLTALLFVRSKLDIPRGARMLLIVFLVVWMFENLAEESASETILEHYVYEAGDPATGYDNVDMRWNRRLIMAARVAAVVVTVQWRLLYVEKLAHAIENEGRPTIAARIHSQRSTQRSFVLTAGVMVFFAIAIPALVIFKP